MGWLGDDPPQKVLALQKPGKYFFGLKSMIVCSDPKNIYTFPSRKKITSTPRCPGLRRDYVVLVRGLVTVSCNLREAGPAAELRGLARAPI